MRVAVFITLLLLSPAVFASGNSEEQVQEAEAGINLEELIESDTEFLLLDVRTDKEYQDGHIPGAINIPYDQISELFQEDNKDILIVLYCRSGRRSGIASDSLRAMGFFNLFDYKRFSDWNGKVITGNEPE